MANDKAHQDVADACCKTDVHKAIAEAALQAPSPEQAAMEAAHREASMAETVRRDAQNRPKAMTLVEDALVTMRRASAEIDRLRAELLRTQRERDFYKAERVSMSHERMRLTRRIDFLEERLGQYEDGPVDNHAGADRPEIDRLADRRG